MGYGKRAIKLLKDYYEGQFTNIDEDMDNQDNGEFVCIKKSQASTYICNPVHFTFVIGRIEIIFCSSMFSF